MTKISHDLKFLLIFTAAIFFISCGGSAAPPPDDPGTLRIAVDQIPIPGIEGVSISVERVDIIWTEDLSEKGTPITISSLPGTLKLVGFQGLTPSIFGDFPGITPGYITQIRFIVNEASADINGKPVGVTIPSGEQTGLKTIVIDAVIEMIDQYITSVTLRLDPDKSLIEINKNKNELIFIPVIKAELGETTSIPIGQYVEQEILVKFKPEIMEEEVESLNVEIGATILSKDLDLNLYQLKLPSTITVEDANEFYSNSDATIHSFPNFIGFTAQFQLIPNDPLFDDQYGLHNTAQRGGIADADINAPEAWDIQTGSKNIVVAVLDTGVNINHVDLSGNIWTNSGEIPGNRIDDDGNGYIDDINGWGFVNNSNMILDPLAGHGTAVSGIIGATGNNSQGIAGISWNVSIMVVKVADDYGNATIYNWIRGMKYAYQMGAHITNSSLRWIFADETYKSVLEDAYESIEGYSTAYKMLNIVAAGNEGVNIDYDSRYWFPSEVRRENLITVAATNEYDNLTTFSCFGTISVDIAAPGDLIRSTNNDGTWGYYSGTSYATPFVTGVAGLIMAEFPSLKYNPVTVKNKILDNADQLSTLKQKVISKRRLNAYSALIQ